MENGDGPDTSGLNAHQRAKALKIKVKNKGMISDQEIDDHPT
jgi:hypothetical protein